MDAGLLDAQRGPGASIVDEQGVLVYPAATLTPEELDIVDDKGIVSYCETQAGAVRAGKNPLVVEAIGLKGASHCQLVVSNETAEKIRAAERRSKFLAHWAVCFLTRPQRRQIEGNWNHRVHRGGTQRTRRGFYPRKDTKNEIEGKREEKNSSYSSFRVPSCHLVDKKSSVCPLCSSSVDSVLKNLESLCVIFLR